MHRFFTDRTPPSADALSRKYDAHADHWRSRIGKAESVLTGNHWRDDLIGYLHGDILEIGVAVGDNLLRLGHNDHSVTSFTGIDISPRMLELATKSAEVLDIPVRLVEADAQDLSLFADYSFDTVTASLVFCTISDVPRALAEITRVLKPGGKLVLIEHVLSPHRLVAAGQKFLAPMQIRYIGCHLDRTTPQTLIDNGYIIEEQRQRVFGVMRFIVATPPNLASNNPESSKPDGIPRLA